MKDTIRQLIQQAITQLVNEGVLPEGLSPAIQVAVSYTHLTLPTKA